MAEIRSVRRYYLAKRQASLLECDGLDQVWRAKQEEQPGTALPADFPLRSRLSDAGYTTGVDLDGADETELMASNFTQPEAAAVLRAFSDL